MTRAVMMICAAAGFAMAQDPVSVASGNYKVLAENDDVRVLEATLTPGSKTVMHSHPALMSVMLEPAVVKWTMADGKVVKSDPKAKRGSIVSMDAQTHVSENTGKQTLRAILIEFKKPAPAAAQARKAPSEASCKVVGESAYATAQLCGGAAGATVAKHTHSATVVYVALTPLTADITDDAGKTHKLELKKDGVALGKPETHTAKNTGKAAYQLIQVDLK